MWGVFMKNLIISIGADHKGFDHKSAIIKHLESLGIKVIDCGPNSCDSVDYPDYAKKVCKDVQSGVSTFGILICYTGIGMSIVANKHRGIRGALVNKVENAKLTRNHNNANVLCLGAKDTEIPLAIDIVDTFIKEEFEGGRHIQRVNKIEEVENNEER